MAQGNSQEFDSITKEEDNKDMLECPVCLQSCIHPARLPCGHTFCFLCVKGVANQSKRCALCRAEIPVDFLDHPYLVPNYEEPEVAHNGYQWFYEGRNGWWQYDERTSLELEASFTKHEKTCELLIAGFLYLIDFETMMQIRRNDPRRKRQIKRDISTIPKKGVAGIRIEGCSNTENMENAALTPEEISDELTNQSLTENVLAQYPEIVETNIAYQSLDQSNNSEEVLDESDFSDNEDIDNTESLRRSSLEPNNLSHDSVESHEFENFILNRIRSLNLIENNNSESD